MLFLGSGQQCFESNCLLYKSATLGSWAYNFLLVRSKSAVQLSRRALLSTKGPAAGLTFHSAKYTKHCILLHAGLRQSSTSMQSLRQAKGRSLSKRIIPQLKPKAENNGKTHFCCYRGSISNCADTGLEQLRMHQVGSASYRSISLQQAKSHYITCSNKALLHFIIRTCPGAQCNFANRMSLEVVTARGM